MNCEDKTKENEKEKNKSLILMIKEKTKSTCVLMIHKKMFFLHLAFIWSGVS
jgi:hypothetical protein